MTKRFIISYCISSIYTAKSYNVVVDVEMRKDSSADEDHHTILKAVEVKHNSIVSDKIEWDQIGIHSICQII